MFLEQYLQNLQFTQFGDTFIKLCSWCQLKLAWKVRFFEEYQFRRRSFFENFNFLTTVSSKMVPNFWRSVWSSVKVKFKKNFHFTNFFAHYNRILSSLQLKNLSRSLINDLACTFSWCISAHSGRSLGSLTRVKVKKKRNALRSLKLLLQ